MIRRPSGNDLLLITQPDHAALSGFLAQHIGNASFDKVGPDTISGIASHDAGWSLHDDAPTLNPAGLPLHVFETPPAPALRIWSASVESAMPLGPYAALLVSLHQLALSDLFFDGSRKPTPRDAFEVNKFQHRQIELQEQLRRELNLRVDRPLRLGLATAGTDAEEDRLRHDFRLLTLCDRLSLILCCGKSLFPVIEEIYPRAGSSASSIETKLVNDATLEVTPWPFDRAELLAEIPCRRVPATPFASEEAFRAAYAEAPREMLRAKVTSVSSQSVGRGII